MNETLLSFFFKLIQLGIRTRESLHLETPLPESTWKELLTLARKQSGLSCSSHGLSSCGGGTGSNYPTGSSCRPTAYRANADYTNLYIPQIINLERLKLISPHTPDYKSEVTKVTNLGD